MAVTDARSFGMERPYRIRRTSDSPPLPCGTWPELRLELVVMSVEPLVELVPRSATCMRIPLTIIMDPDGNTMELTETE
jgi:hypothetical protein